MLINLLETRSRPIVSALGLPSGFLKRRSTGYPFLNFVRLMRDLSFARHRSRLRTFEFKLKILHEAEGSLVLVSKMWILEIN